MNLPACGSASGGRQGGFAGPQERLGPWASQVARRHVRSEAMGRPPIAVIVAATLIGLQGVLVALVAGLLYLFSSALKRDQSVTYMADIGLASAGLLGLLLFVGAIMLFSRIHRWAVAVAVFEVLLLTLLLALQPRKSFDAASDRSVLSPGGLTVLMWFVVPVICLLLPSSRRWFRRRE